MEQTTLDRSIKTPEDLELIPPLPTRQQELEYLDKLELDLRTQPYSKKKYVADPARKKRMEIDDDVRHFKKSYWRLHTAGSLLLAPLAFWITGHLPAKANMQGIPFRATPTQFKFRFWTCFFVVDYALARVFAGVLQDKSLLQQYKYPLYQLQERKL